MLILSSLSVYVCRTCSRVAHRVDLHFRVNDDDHKNRQLDRLSGNETTTMAPQFTMRPRDRRVQVTFPVRLTCQVIGFPKPDVTWYHNNNPIVCDGKFFRVDSVVSNYCRTDNFLGRLMAALRVIMTTSSKPFVWMAFYWFSCGLIVLFWKFLLSNYFHFLIGWCRAS